jgi:hypothetical protein
MFDDLSGQVFPDANSDYLEMVALDALRRPNAFI